MTESYSKNPKNWSEAMQGEYGISALHEAYFTEIQNDSYSETTLNFFKNQVSIETFFRDTGEQSEFPLASLTSAKTNRYLKVKESFPNVPKLIIAGTETEDSSHDVLLKNLLTSAGTLAIASYYLLGQNRFDRWRNFASMPDKQSTAMSSLDLNTPTAVLLDNFDTLLNVFRVATYDMTETSQQLEQMERLVSKDHGDERGLTQLEQCARAPFGFWALTRKIVPIACGGEPIVTNGEGFSHRFLQTLRTEKVLSTTEPNVRHGGCPALYPAFRSFDHVNKLGKLFIIWHKRLHS
ncbi:MAG: hypothetical protein RLZZ360_534 [Candidatus Parcubacteria bacterium]|jgi:hypothetical protein